MSLITSRSSLRILIPAILVALVPLTACTPASSAPDAGAVPGTARGELTPDQRDQCENVFARTIDATDQPGIVVVEDQTSSTVPHGLSAALAEAIVDASIDDAPLTIIAVDGAGEQPRILAKNVALSTPGPRDRPSVADLAAVMPMCVQGVLLAQAKPTAEGTDLHAAIALASELSTADSAIFIESDLMSTSGPFALTAEILALPVASAVERIAAAAPVDLHNAQLHINGVGNTSTPLLTADREWLRALAVGLCGAWHARGCDSIAVSPVNAEAHDGPADPVPSFPRTTEVSASGACTYETPASITFGGDSADLHPDAADVFAQPIALLQQNPAATATIVGHTASSVEDSREALLDLSHRRAQAVADLFVSSGVAMSRLTVVGVGDTQPRVEDIDPATGQQIEEAAAKERRVDIRVEGASCPE